jgi:hypothetical protein
MELYEVLNNFCSRNSGAVSKDDKKKYSYMLRRLFSSQYPMQCDIINRLDSDALCSSNIIALLANRYNGLPAFLRIRVDQKKKKETIYKFFEDDVINKYMDINECGIREVEEAYDFCPEEINKAMKLIKGNYFNNKDKVIVKKVTKEDKEQELF